MSITRITKEQIVAVAEALVAEGKIPTCNAVRKKLEGGSYSDICPALKEWRTESADAHLTSRIPLPETMQAHLTNLGKNVWTDALATTEANLAPQPEAHGKLREAEQQVGILQGQSEAYLKEIAMLEAIYREQAAKIKALKGEVAAFIADMEP